MDNRYINGVIAEIKPLLDEQGFVLENGVYKNDKKVIKVDYSEDRQSYLLLAADVEDGTEGELTEISAWLFDDSQTQADAISVGMDFADTLRKNMGIKIKASSAASSVELPTATKSGSIKIAGFTKKVLDVYPQYKEEYKAHIAKYGNFLYLNFFGQTLVPQIKVTLAENNKKSRKKLLEMLEIGYVNGDKETVNAVIASLAAAAYNDNNTKALIDEMLKDNKHFKDSFNNFFRVFSSKSKLKKFFGIND